LSKISIKKRTIIWSMSIEWTSS